MIDPRLSQTVARVLRLDPSLVTPDTSAKTTPAWDSVAHLSLILDLEDVFDVRFPTEEIPNLNTVGRLQEVISRLNSP